MTIYSTHIINDGKWQVTIWIKQDQDFAYDPEQRPDLRALIDAHYNESPKQLAQTVLDNVLHCERCHVQSFSGVGVYVEKECR